MLETLIVIIAPSPSHPRSDLVSRYSCTKAQSCRAQREVADQIPEQAYDLGNCRYRGQYCVLALSITRSAISHSDATIKAKRGRKMLD